MNAKDRASITKSDGPRLVLPARHTADYAAAMEQVGKNQNGSCDLAIVGGGLAGLVAATRASELGLAVILVESGDGDRYPCNVRYSGGVFHVAFNEIKSDPAILRQVIERVTAGGADPEQVEAMACHAGRFVDWFRTQGAEFTRTDVSWQTHILAPSRDKVAGQDWRGRGPDVMLRRLAERIRERGSVIWTATRGQALLKNDGACVGIEVSTPEGQKQIRARAVVLADGGFQADLALIGAHITLRPEALKQRGGASGVGDGLRMAQEFGAKLTRLDRFYGHLLCRDAMTNDNVWPYPELDALALAGVLVDAAGRRFFDEGRGGVALANAVARLPDPLSATAVFDTRIWEGPGRSARIPANPALANAGGTILRAGSVAELAAKAGIDAEGLHLTITAHNQALREGVMSGLVPPRSTEKHTPMPIDPTSLMAIPVCAGITYTMGGVLVDGHSRVLDQSGAPISGLYAAGSTTGGLEGGEHAAYIGGLTKAGVQGLLAAEDVARRVGRTIA